MNNLETYHLKEVKTFCQINSKIIILKEDKKELEYLRGQYKGFAYGIKTINNLLSQANLCTKKTNLYKHFKEQQVLNCTKHKEGRFYEGIKESFYKIMNLISGLK